MNKETRELLEKHFDTAFDAPDGIKKLRELILTLAMQGKLVPQDPNDQPASELLKEIEAEKKRLNKEGKIKKTESLTPIKTGELPFSLPPKWEWVRFGDIAIIERGGSPRPIKAYLTNATDGLNWIKISDTDQGGKYIIGTKEKIRPEGLAKTRMVYPGDFLLTNSMSFGRPYITQIEGCIHDGWLRISPPNSLEKDYLYNLLSSSFVRKMFEIAAAGAVVLNLNSEKVRFLPIPFPPKGEQQRIVEKIDQLMARVDELEKLRNERQEKRLKIHAAAIDQLLSAKSDADFAAAWGFITGNFDSLYSVKENVAELRKAILQLAVMGKLSKPLDTDSPVLAIIEKIILEIKKDKEIKASEKDFAFSLLNKSKKRIKNNRVILKTRAFCSFITKGTTPQANELLEVGEIPFIKVYNIVNNKIDFEYRPTFVSDSTHKTKLKRSKIFPGDVIMNIVGPPLGKVAIIPSHYPEWNMNQALAYFRPRANIFNRYIYYLLTTHSILKSAIREVKGTAGQDNLSLEQCRDIEIPIPSVEEQHRIVDKIDQLMTLCDTLEQRLTNATEKQASLLNSLMAKV
ncbi:MAG: restriction endonuclease subunit S [Candidatus Riflebacteria bacterium]|nr:restriction endonuclease subunit S [Candidatus Riflebacteria bacterium]